MTQRHSEEYRQVEHKFAVVRKEYSQLGDERSAKRANKLARRLGALDKRS